MSHSSSDFTVLRHRAHAFVTKGIVDWILETLHFPTFNVEDIGALPVLALPV